MAVESEEYREKSLKTLIERCEKLNGKKKLTEKQKTLLTELHTLAADSNDSITLGFQSDAVIMLIIKQLATFSDKPTPDAAVFIYSKVTDQFDREKVENQRKHSNQGRYDVVFIQNRSTRDQLQDHDMNRLMPGSYGNIDVLAPANRFDAISLDVKEGMIKALKNKQIKHIFIPVGPGHWRGFYLTKPDADIEKYQLELFDPFGPSGANEICDFSLDLLKQCGIEEDQVTITTTGPTYPQRDVYACGDFTCAYSHKKMKELGAPSSAYIQEYITVLDSQGNKNDVLRHKSRELSKSLETRPVVPLVPLEEVERDDLQFTEVDRREFLIQLGKQLTNPDKIDKVVLDKEIAKIKSTFGTYKFASLRELDAYGVFNADGSINKVIATQYEIQFDEPKIKKRLEFYGLKHLSFREMIIFESVISSVIRDLTSENTKKALMLEAELHNLADWDPNLRSRRHAIKTELEYVKSHPPGKGLARACFAEFGSASKEFKLTHPLSMELAGPAKQMVGMGYFKFKDINVSISPGPYSARSLTPSKNPELYEPQRDIARYLNNLLTNNVTHVFAMGRVRPYAPMQEGLEHDFINYFIPDAHGRVTLPNIPELKDINITSRPIEKVGRFITYEISINGSNPIQIHHFPIQDKQPLKLAPEELAYVKNVGTTASVGENIHTHCRDGKGCSRQIAYLLTSLNPQYKQANHAELIAQMSTEKAAAFLEEDLELYVIYGTLLKQEIDKHLKQIGSQKIVKEEHKDLLALMEKYHELNSTPFPQLEAWVASVSQNPIIDQSTKPLFASLKSSTDFLVHAFKENRNPEELELFFDLQARRGGYQAILVEFALISTDPRLEREEEARLKKYESLFVARLQDAYLKNWKKISQEDRIVCVEVKANVSETLVGILDALITKHDPKKFTREVFDNLKREYERCIQRIELLEKIDDDYEMLDDELMQRSKVIAQLLVLGYDNLEVNPEHLITKMHLIYQRLGELSAANELSPQQWDELKKQFTALKTILNFIEPDKEKPDILLTLDKLFQGKREHLTHPFKWAISQVNTKTGHLDNYVGELGYAVLDAAFNELPKGYYGENGNGAYSKEIKQILDAITHLGETYKKPAPEKIDLLREPKFLTEKECEPVRQQVLQLISKHAPFLITATDDLRVRFENLDRDYLRLEKHSQLRAPEFQELKTRFDALKSEYLISGQHNVLMNQLIEKIEEQIKKVVALEAKDGLLLDSSAEKYSKSLDNILRIKAIKSGASQTTLDEIDYFESRIEKHIPKGIRYPKPPKLIVFDIADVLTDFSTNELKRVNELIHVLQYAEKHSIEVVLTTNGSPSPDTEDQALITKLKAKIAKEAGIDISNRLTFLNAVPLRQEKATIEKYLQSKISLLQQEIERLKSATPPAEDKEKLQAILKKLQLKLNSLIEKSATVRLSSGKFLNLDVVRHSHGFKDLDSYYQAVEGGVLKDFKDPELAKNIRINDFIEKRETWINLFKLAKVLMHSKSLKNPKPSLQTVLKDLIFDANKPERLQKKYGDLHQWAEAIQGVNAARAYFIRHIPQIDSFYQDRLAIQKLMYENSTVLNEEDIVFFEAEQDVIDRTHQHSNYRAIKLNDYNKDSFQYMIDLNYEMGAYNGVIAYLNEDKDHSPKAYGPKGINKTLESYLSSIPNFAEHGFQHSPIVLHVKMSTVLAKLPELSTKDTVQKRYMEQFFEAAMERFNQLPEELQDDFVTTYYRDADHALKAINQRLKELITSPPQDLMQFQNELIKLTDQLNKLIKKDAKFSRRVSPTFIGPEAKLLVSMIERILTSGNIDELSAEAEQVRFKKDHDKNRAMLYTEALANEPQVYLREIHPALKKLGLVNTAFIAEQYSLFVMQRLEPMIREYFDENATEQVAPTLPSLLGFLQDFMTQNDPDKNDKFKILPLLPLVKKLGGDLLKIVPYENMAHNLKGETNVDYNQQISALLKQATDYTSKIESSEEYKAKLFLDKAEQYLLTKEWNVGLQWTPRTVEVNGEEKSIPATVAEQLEVINRARKDHNYLDAKAEFIRIGHDKEISWTTSSYKARKYYSLFKFEENESDETSLEMEFSTINETSMP
ncbi:Dot/Icm secretion system substrate [Legionella steigerwaltii]|uniref:Dot/Icm secretion system substrate n=1 Tax=Legionella steigerwaltii TaxID=460 RepID=A0A378LCI9_9GAMM|nr:hypothetical protein [Legionella steigerwaltii]KTD78571.1 substrate of the Dot/Icm secretion system [Legionella steigerwaltii]STY24070.1 Dot/Icm secretion system substrate [Legionella steigerwaltii]